MTIFVIFFGIGAATAPGPEDDDVIPTSTTTTEPAKESTTAEALKTPTDDYDDLKVDVTLAKAAATQNSVRRSVTSTKKSSERQAEVPIAGKQSKATVTHISADNDAEVEATNPEEEPTKVEKSTTKIAEEPTTKVVKSSGGTVQITDDEYYYICCLVYGEAGAEPYDGQVLVAQCFYNAMEECGKDAYSTAKAYGYTGSTQKGTNQSVKKAVAAVFYDGYRYTKEPVLFFYAPGITTSSWHESQTLVCEVGGHRFFKRNGS